MGTPGLTADSTMGEILSAYPTAKTVLFARFHIGGCTSCSYQPDQTLAEVRAQHGVPAPVEAMLAAIHDSASIEATLRITPEALRTALAGPTPPRLLDARSPAEHAWTRIAGTELLTAELTFAILDEWPKDTPLVVISNNGDRSLQKAAHLACYGCTAVRSLDGGLRAWMAAGGPVQESAAAQAARG